MCLAGFTAIVCTVLYKAKVDDRMRVLTAVVAQKFSDENDGFVDYDDDEDRFVVTYIQSGHTRTRTFKCKA